MSSLESSSGNRLFNCVYIEEAARSYPLAQAVLRRFADTPAISVRHYKDVFNRPNQRFRRQKQDQSLILAVKEEPFLYRGPAVCQSFGASRFLYTSLMLNCLYDCEYCYLQGLYPSANLVAFVNTGDFQAAIANEADQESLYLAASHDTDLIALHAVLPYLDELRPFLASQANLLMEIRTKSANPAFFSQYPPLPSIVIAFTLTPAALGRRYEKGTPALEARLSAIQTAIRRGFQVRICFDPILIGQEWDDLYEPFFHQVFACVDPQSIVDVGYGFFRMPRDLFARIEKQRADSPLFAASYVERGGVLSYDPDRQAAIQDRHLALLSRYLAPERIFML